MHGVDEINGLADDVARQVLLDCCSSPRWVTAVAGARPYPSLEALLAQSDAAVAAMAEADLREALAGHPRIADPRVVGGAHVAGGGQPGWTASAQERWSGQEQAGVGEADSGTLAALAEGNARYEARFGHIYLACATGRNAAELLAFLRERLHNDRETEWRVVASELAKINQIRLRKLIAVGRRGAVSAVSTHILDTVTGEPAAGVLVRLERAAGGELGRAATDDDGRISDFGVSSLPEGTYRLVFETGPYLRGGLAGGHAGGPAGGQAGETAFFPEVVVTFHADGLRRRYHVPLLLSPYSYSTYRGS